MTVDPIYLDYSATTPPRPEAIEAVTHALQQSGNPSSVHAAGRSVRGLVESARRQVAASVNARAESLVFTSGATEANVTAVTRTGAERLIVSAVEHESVLNVAEDCGLPHQIVPVDNGGVLDLAELQSALSMGEGRALVCVMLVNNETGAIQPVAEATRMAHEAGAQIHCDAVQGLGKIPVDFDGLGVDFMSISAHKMGGPLGVGALIARDPAQIQPLIRGGGQEHNYRAGTENVPGIVGFGRACELLTESPVDWAAIQTWRDRWEDRIRSLANDAVVFSDSAPRLPGTSLVAMPGVTGETQVMSFDLEGLCVSSGSACSSGKVKASRILKAMGVEESLAGSVIRVSMGWNSREEDLDRLFDAWSALYRRTRQREAS